MLKDPNRVGEFMPAERRREKAIDFKSTHFKLGGGVGKSGLTIDRHLISEIYE